MKRRRSIPLLLLLSILMTGLSGCTAPRPGTSFDLETEGLMLVQTVREGDHEVKYFALAPGVRIMDTGPFIADETRVFTVSGFCGMDNETGPLRAYDEDGAEVPVTREISTICRAMGDVGHNVMECRILKAGDEWFASAMLNVNWWTPYHFYYFDRGSGRLTLLYEFNGREVTALRILSAEGLHALDQKSIGGWQDPITPDRLMAERPEVLGDAAGMLLRRKDLFDEAAARNRDHERRIGWDGSGTQLYYSALLHDVIRGNTRITFLSDSEKAAFRELLDLCPPYEIVQIPGGPESCAVLLFRFSVFSGETNRQEEWTLFRIDGEADDPAYARTVSQLEAQHGELTECPLPGWLMISAGQL